MKTTAAHAQAFAQYMMDDMARGKHSRFNHMSLEERYQWWLENEGKEYATQSRAVSEEELTKNIRHHFTVCDNELIEFLRWYRFTLRTLSVPEPKEPVQESSPTVDEPKKLTLGEANKIIAKAHPDIRYTGPAVNESDGVEEYREPSALEMVNQWEEQAKFRIELRKAFDVEIEDNEEKEQIWKGVEWLVRRTVFDNELP